MINTKVEERKFNAVSTVNVYDAENKDLAKSLARQFFKDEYGHSPSKVVAEEKRLAGSITIYEVMVADHSSGSLKDSRSYGV